MRFVETEKVRANMQAHQIDEEPSNSSIVQISHPCQNPNVSQKNPPEKNFINNNTHNPPPFCRSIDKLSNLLRFPSPSIFPNLLRSNDSRLKAGKARPSKIFNKLSFRLRTSKCGRSALRFIDCIVFWSVVRIAMVRKDVRLKCEIHIAQTQNQLS